MPGRAAHDVGICTEFHRYSFRWANCSRGDRWPDWSELRAGAIADRLRTVTPADKLCIAKLKNASAMQVSNIVPVLNEAAQIRPFLKHLKSKASGAEVIVSDGGSSDGTVERAGGLCDRVVVGQRGRPPQMNSAADQARGDILWFLYVDCEVPDDCLRTISNAIADHRVVGGCFRIHDELAHPVGRFMRVRCGDHGIFVRRSVFDAVGRYPDVPLMEDVELFRSVQRVGRVAWLPDRLIVSSRRHEQVGVYRYTLLCAMVIILYWLGVRPTFLARLYTRLIPQRGDASLPRPVRPVEDAIFSEFRS